MKIIIIFTMFCFINLSSFANESSKPKDNYPTDSIFIDVAHQKAFSVDLGLLNQVSYGYSHRAYNNYTYKHKGGNEFYAKGTYNFLNSPYSMILSYQSSDFSSYNKNHRVSYESSSINIGGKITNQINPKFAEDWPFINQNIELYAGGGLSFSNLNVNDPHFAFKEKRNSNGFFFVLGAKAKIHKNYPFYLSNDLIYNTSKVTFKHGFYSIGPGFFSSLAIGFEF